MAAVLFWHNLDGTDVLPACAWDGLLSVADNGGFSSVELCSYQRFRRLQLGVIAQPAEGVLPYERFKEYVRGVSAVLGDKAIAPVADLVRLKACADTAHAFVAMIDCDSVWFRNMPMPDPHDGNT